MEVLLGLSFLYHLAPVFNLWPSKALQRALLLPRQKLEYFKVMTSERLGNRYTTSALLGTLSIEEPLHMARESLRVIYPISRFRLILGFMFRQMRAILGILSGGLLQLTPGNPTASSVAEVLYLQDWIQAGWMATEVFGDIAGHNPPFTSSPRQLMALPFHSQITHLVFPQVLGLFPGSY